MHSWDHLFNSKSAILPTIDHICRAPFEHESPFAQSSDDTKGVVSGEVYLAATFQNPQLLFCPHFFRSTLSKTYSDQMPYKSFQEDRNDVDSLLHTQTILPQKVNIERVTNTLNKNNHNYVNFDAATCSKLPCTTTNGERILKGVSLTQCDHTGETKRRFLLCCLDHEGKLKNYLIHRHV